MTQGGGRDARTMPLCHVLHCAAARRGQCDGIVIQYCNYTTINLRRDRENRHRERKCGCASSGGEGRADEEIGDQASKEKQLRNGAEQAEAKDDNFLYASLFYKV